MRIKLQDPDRNLYRAMMELLGARKGLALELAIDMCFSDWIEQQYEGARLEASLRQLSNRGNP